MVKLNLIFPKSLQPADAKRRLAAQWAKARRARDPEAARARDRMRKQPVLTEEQRVMARKRTNAWRKRNPHWSSEYRAKNIDRFNELARIRHAADPGKACARQREWAYGISRADYEAMRSRQNDLCAICSNPETAIGRGGTPRLLSVDHDHATGAIRALLCVSCNTALGHMKDNPERLRAAATYLESFRR
ncbi:MAG: hypothetical protein EPN91_02105 [Salinibacterium sp.]|nr:MAG: hypothetical protein EPN91_02105 [Salinibacterium sp.]